MPAPNPPSVTSVSSSGRFGHAGWLGTKGGSITRKSTVSVLLSTSPDMVTDSRRFSSAS